MKTYQVNFIGSFVVGDQTLPVKMRFRTDSPNHYSLIGVSNSEFLPQAAGTLVGHHERHQEREVRAESAFVSGAPEVSNPLGTGPEYEVGFSIDELSVVNKEVRKYLGTIPFPEGTHLTSTWLLSGSRFLAELLADKPLELAIARGRATLYLVPDEHGDVVARSGHALRETTFLPELRCTAEVGNLKVAATDAICEGWQNDVEFLASCLGFYSQATVNWLSERRAFVLAEGEEPERELSRRFRFRRISTGPVAPKQILTAADVRLNLESTLAIARQWGNHLCSAIEFYVSSFLLSDESRFIALSTAVEALKEAFLVGRGAPSILPKADWKLLRKAVEEACRDTLSKIDRETLNRDEAFELVSEKVGELNRPSYKRVVRQLVDHLGTKVDDLYPVDFTFIPVRNEMVHAGILPPKKELAAESERLAKLVERLIGGALMKGPASSGPRTSPAGLEPRIPTGGLPPEAALGSPLAQEATRAPNADADVRLSIQPSSSSAEGSAPDPTLLGKTLADRLPAEAADPPAPLATVESPSHGSEDPGPLPTSGKDQG